MSAKLKLKLNAEALESLSIRARLSQDVVDAAPRMRAKLPRISEIAWRSDKTINGQLTFDRIIGDVSKTFAAKTEELELEILNGGMKSNYEEAFECLHDISKTQPSKGVQDKIIEYLLRLVIIDRWAWGNIRINSIKALVESFRPSETTSSSTSLASSTKRSSKPLRRALSPPTTIHLHAQRAPVQRLLDQVADLGKTYEVQKRTKVEENVATAALYVSFLFSGLGSFDEFLQGIEEHNAKADSNAKKSLTNAALLALRKPSTLPRRPLQYSAFISVLTLLVGQKLSSRSGKIYTDWEMLQDGITLGFPHIQSVCDIDRGMWSAIFSVAMGDVGVREAVGELSNVLPFDEIAKLPDSDDKALQFADLGTKFLDNGDIVMNTVAGGSVTQGHEWEGEDADDDGPLLVIVREVPMAVEGMPKLQQISGADGDEVSIQLANLVKTSLVVQQEVRAQATQKVIPMGSGQEGSRETTPATEHPVVEDRMEMEGGDGVTGSRLGVAADLTIPGFTVNMNVDEPGPTISGAGESELSEVPNSPPFPENQTSSEDEEEAAPKQPRGIKRSLFVSSEESSSEEHREAVPDPPQMDVDTNHPASRPRRATRNNATPPIDPNTTSTKSARPPRKKKKPVLSPTVEDVGLADDEAEDVKPRLWAEQSLWEGSVSALLEYMEDEVIEVSDIDNEIQEDKKRWLDVKPMDNSNVVVVKKFSLFDVAGVQRDYTFKFTDEDDALFFQQLIDAVHSNYVRGMPRHLSDPKSSVFHILEYKEPPQGKPFEMLSLFEKQVIIINDYPAHEVAWTPEAMSKFGFLNPPQTIYDLSKPKVRIDRHGKEKPVLRDHWGTLGMLYDCSQLPNPKPLLSLDNNMPGGGFWHDGAVEIATDLLGFNVTDKHPEGEKAILPFNDQAWSLFATAGASSLSHIDADGAATLVQPCHGTKLWFIIRGPDPHSAYTLAWPGQFNPPWALDRADFMKIPKDHTMRHLLRVEVMVLQGRMRMLMPPNTPHAVLSPTNSIFQGGHFYSLTTMRDTFAGLVHMLVQEKFITNTSHPALRMMIRKVVAYVHGNIFPRKYAKVDRSQCFNPQKLDQHTMTYLFAVVSLGFLSNILDPRTYRIRQDEEQPTQEEVAMHTKYDYNAMPPSDRRGCIWTRGMAVELAEWFSAHYDLTNPTHNVKVDAAQAVYDAVAHEAIGILVAAKCVEAEPKRTDMCAVGATSVNIRQQLECLDNVPMVEKGIKSRLELFDKGQASQHFNLLYNWSDWTCCAKTPPDVYKPYSDQEIIKWGCTKLDNAYIKGEECHFRID